MRLSSSDVSFIIDVSLLVTHYLDRQDKFPIGLSSRIFQTVTMIAAEGMESDVPPSASMGCSWLVPDHLADEDIL
jgi:hypothetical protein